MNNPIHGELRLDPKAPNPWRYRGILQLPSGRYVALHARVIEDQSGKHFQIDAGLEPGMSGVELETELTELETTRAGIARREILETDELPF